MSNRSAFWWISYFVTLAAIAWGTLELRRWALAELDNPAARAQWAEYKDSAAREARRVPKATEPPALIMLRDRFWVVMSAAMVFGSLFFGFAVYVTRGLRRSANLPDTRPADEMQR